MTSPFAILWRIDQIWPTLERHISPLRTVHNSSRQWSFLSRHSLYVQTNESFSRSLRAFGQSSFLSVWEVCNFKCFLLDGCYVSVLRLSSCICRFTHSIQWYMDQIWQCKTGSHLLQILGVEKCQLQTRRAARASEYGLEKLLWYIDRYDARRGSVLLANVISPRNINVL